MIEIIHGKSEIILPERFPENYFHSMVTDPPYGLSFMSKKWDYNVPSVAQWQECYRVLKPGAFILVACGTRTQHRMTVNIEDAGFEIRDVICWHYGSGFPKSLNVSLAIDNFKGAERPTELKMVGDINNVRLCGKATSPRVERSVSIDEPQTEEAKKWQGYGTALKPATEFFTLARKPLNGIVAENVLLHGVGGLNINACKIEFRNENDKNETVNKNQNVDFCSNDGVRSKAPNGIYSPDNRPPENYNPDGRFPANVIFDEYTGNILDLQSGECPGFVSNGNAEKGEHSNGVISPMRRGKSVAINDSGGASRFFYCAKASKSERNFGLENFEKKKPDRVLEHGQAGTDNPFNRGATIVSNFHPTVKPIKLMQYLIKLVTPANGIVLDPFNGSGTTGIACKLEGFNYVGIEMDSDYCNISRARINAWQKDVEKHVQQMEMQFV